MPALSRRAFLLTTLAAGTMRGVPRLVLKQKRNKNPNYNYEYLTYYVFCVFEIFLIVY